MGIRPATPEVDRKAVTDPDALRKMLGSELDAQHGEIRHTLDVLRRTRKARGGVGAPLQVPPTLGAQSLIVVTDADLNAVDQARMSEGERSEEDTAVRRHLIDKGVLDEDEA